MGRRPARLMREMAVRQKRRFDLAGRAQSAGPGLRGGGAGPEMEADISYIWTAEGWL